MIYQIAGTVLVTTSIICATWYLTTLRREQNERRDREKRERAARNERMYADQSFALYQYEAQRRQEAETREGIAQNQLKRARSEIQRLKDLIKELEENS